MPAALTLLTPPAGNLIELADAKAHLSVTVDDADDEIAAYLAEAVADAQRETRRAFLTATYVAAFDGFPAGCDRSLRLPIGRVQAVEEVRYYDADGELQTVDPADYFEALRGEPARLIPKSGYWPATEWGRPESVEVEFTAGYGDDAEDVPADLIGAVKLLLGDRYRNRGDAATPAIPAGAARVFLSHLYPES